jgi:hypothetical protein
VLCFSASLVEEVFWFNRSQIDECRQDIILLLSSCQCTLHEREAVSLLSDLHDVFDSCVILFRECYVIMGGGTTGVIPDAELRF